MLDAGDETGVAIGRCAGVEPWQDDVDGDVVQPAGAEQRLRRRKPPGAEGPVSRPVVVSGGKAAQQRSGGRWFFRRLADPVVKPVDEIALGHPMRGQGQAALGPVGGAESVEGPGAVWQDAPGPAVAVTPPPIPERAQIALGEFVAVELVGQQSADAEQTGEQHNRLGRLAKAAAQLRQKLGEPPHRPTVLLVA